MRGETAPAPFSVRVGAQGSAARSHTSIPDKVPLGPATKIIMVELALVLLTQKVAIPLGDAQAQLALVIHLGCLGLLAGRGLLGVNKLQCLLYTLTVGLAIIAHVAAPKPEFSLPSLLLFTVIYLTFCFGIEISKAEYYSALRAYQSIALAVCGLVGLDWALQLVGLHMPNLEAVLPHSMVLDGYAYIQPLVWGSPLMKPNAVFFLETSTVGQFLAIALVIEVCFFQRNTYLAIYLTAMLATFSGSGMVLVAATSPFMLPHLSKRLMTGMLLAGLIGIPVAMGLGVFDNVASRSNELEREDTSGYYRFVAPVKLMDEALSREPMGLLFGGGAGTAAKGFNIIWNPASKSLHEYGLPFAVSYLALIFAICLGSGRPGVLGAVSLINFHFLGGAFVGPSSLIMLWVVVAAYRISDPEEKYG